jgi:hypothetical protein
MLDFVRHATQKATRMFSQDKVFTSKKVEIVLRGRHKAIRRIFIAKAACNRNARSNILQRFVGHLEGILRFGLLGGAIVVAHGDAHPHAVGIRVCYAVDRQRPAGQKLLAITWALQNNML